MANKKTKQKSKIQLSKYFQKIMPGEVVAISRNPSVRSDFPERIQGRTGVVDSQKGRYYVVKIKDMKKEKIYIIEPIHLKKIQIQK